MGVLQELLVHQRKGSHKIFTCPLLDCGVEFRKSCDLTIHFNVEVITSGIPLNLFLDWE